MGYTWLYNNKVILSCVTFNEKNYLVYANNESFGNIKFVENAQTGKRIFPTQDQKNSFSNDSDGLVRMLISLITEE